MQILRSLTHIFHLMSSSIYFQLWYLPALFISPLNDLHSKDKLSTCSVDACVSLNQRQQRETWNCILRICFAVSSATVFRLLFSRLFGGIAARNLKSTITVECFTRFCFVVKMSADKMISKIFDIFSHEFSLFSNQLSF